MKVKVGCLAKIAMLGFFLYIKHHTHNVSAAQVVFVSVSAQECSINSAVSILQLKCKHVPCVCM